MSRDCGGLVFDSPTQFAAAFRAFLRVNFNSGAQTQAHSEFLTVLRRNNFLQNKICETCGTKVEHGQLECGRGKLPTVADELGSRIRRHPRLICGFHHLLQPSDIGQGFTIGFETDGSIIETVRLTIQPEKPAS
jgi:hypothetical protein